MKEKIEKLYNELRDVSAMYLIYQDRKIVQEVREYLPEIQEFSAWFLEKNIFGIEEELYQALSLHLIKTLKDIVEAIDQEDMVLLYDAVAYAFIDYLESFMEEEREEKSDDVI